MHSKIYRSISVESKPVHSTPVQRWVWQLEVADVYIEGSVPQVHQRYPSEHSSVTRCHDSKNVSSGARFTAEVFIVFDSQSVGASEQDVSTFKSLHVDFSILNKCHCKQDIMLSNVITVSINRGLESIKMSMSDLKRLKKKLTSKKTKDKRGLHFHQRSSFEAPVESVPEFSQSAVNINCCQLL